MMNYHFKQASCGLVANRQIAWTNYVQQIYHGGMICLLLCLCLIVKVLCLCLIVNLIKADNIYLQLSHVV